MKYILRIITLPFYMVLVLIGLIVLFSRHSYNWVMHGGEAVAYTSKNERVNIYDIYQELKEQRKNIHIKDGSDESTSHGIALKFSEKFQNNYPSKEGITTLMEELRRDIDRLIIYKTTIQQKGL